VLTRYAFHYQTGERIPDSLIKRITAAKNYGQGFATVEYIASALVDLEMHLNPSAAAADPVGFESQVLAKYKMPGDIVMRHRTTHFWPYFCRPELCVRLLYLSLVRSDGRGRVQRFPGGGQCFRPGGG